MRLWLGNIGCYVANYVGRYIRRWSRHSSRCTGSRWSPVPPDRHSRCISLAFRRRTYNEWNQRVNAATCSSKRTPTNHHQPATQANSASYSHRDRKWILTKVRWFRAAGSKKGGLAPFMDARVWSVVSTWRIWAYKARYINVLFTLLHFTSLISFRFHGPQPAVSWILLLLREPWNQRLSVSIACLVMSFHLPSSITCTLVEQGAWDKRTGGQTDGSWHRLMLPTVGEGHNH